MNITQTPIDSQSTLNGAANSKGRFGTFAGVLTPNLLTILGLILFLRSGWVVGQAGLVGALMIVLLSNLITLFTGFSLSAIATSMKVRTGGNYYLISRSLGLEIGGAIGVPLFLSQAISVAFYIIGFTEALRALPAFQAYDAQLISTGIVLGFAVIAYLGADFALRIQYVVLVALGMALLSFYAGGWGTITTPTWQPNYTEGFSFWQVFAIFFPAVTGITVGASMSGDLKDPAKSIPRGTLGAILITALVYITTIVWLSLHATPDELIANNLIMQEIARWPFFILLGVWSATLSSALGSIVAAPRVLQALAYDRVAPRWMAAQLGSKTEPRMAVLLTTAITLLVIWMGDLNFVAPIITMFFLNTYGMTNLAAAIETLVGNPSYRPRFNTHWSISLLGALGCYAAMFLINPFATIIAIVISYSIYFYLERRTIQHTWGDVRSGIWLTLARVALLGLEEQEWHIKNWRPNILVFTGQPHNREQLVEVADWLSVGRGIVTFYQLLVGKPDQMASQTLRERARNQIRTYIQQRAMTAFAEVDVVANFHTGALTAAQTYGIGNLKANTVLMGWSGTPEGRATQFRLLRDLTLVGKSVLLYSYNAHRAHGKRKIIDIWWTGRNANGALALLLAHIIRQHPAWRQTTIRLLRVVTSEEGKAQTEMYMAQLLEEVRVRATPIVIVEPDRSRSFHTIVTEQSATADLVVLGVAVPKDDEEAVYAEQLNDLLAQIGTALLISSPWDETVLNSES